MKIQTLIFGAIAIILLIVDSYNFYLCNTYKCKEASDAILLSTLIIAATSFIISFALSFVSIKIYSNWWRFARIAIPVIFIISTIINLGLHHTSHGVLMNMDYIFDIPILTTMYMVFIIGSLVQIVRGYLRK